MALADLQVAVDRTTGVAIDGPAQIAFINRALGEIASVRDWPWLDAVATLTGDGTTTSWPLASSWVRTRNLTVNLNEARPVNIGDLDRWVNFEDRPAQYCYAIDAGNLIIQDPIPAATTAVHRYVQTEPTLVGASDNPLLPNRFHNTLINMASKFVLERMGDTKRVPMLDAEVEKGLKRMNDEQDRTRGPKRVRVRDGFPL